MEKRDELRQAAEMLATIRAHQEQTRRAARLPWWVYAAMFVLTAGGMAALDFVDLSGTKLLAIAVLAVLVVVLVVPAFFGGSAPLSWVRGVQPRQSFVPSVFGVVAIVGGVAAWLISHYGARFANDVAGAVDLRQYPNTVAGVLFGAAFTVLFALTQLLITWSQRRPRR